ncbi:ISAs1 family transposase [uncultured Nostoc sp.]|uniref:ISAs1 family transposase n=1 Tax=uncultured Nostoc sp. TaxID=340711 RepID=UPI0035CB7DA2
MKSIQKITEGEVVAIDGKTLCNSYDNNNDKSAIQIVSAWATTNRLVLGQVKVDEKSNEIKAIPELLKVLELSGCI